jgi:hypothetical protein
MIEFTWKIESLEKNIADGGVVHANWRVNAVDGDYRTSRLEASPLLRILIPMISFPLNL